MIADQQGNLFLQNQRCIELWKYPQELIESGDAEKMRQHVLQMVKSSEQFENKVSQLNQNREDVNSEEIELVDGTVLERYSAPIIGKNGKNYGRLWLFHDITERRRAELTLRESESRFRLIAETITDVFWMADAEIGTMIYVSPGYEKIWGLPVTSLYDDPKSFMNSIHVEDRERVSASLRPKEGLPFSHEYRVVRPDGRIGWIWDQGFPIRDQAGHVTGYAGIAHDITEQRQAQIEKTKIEAQLLQAQKMESDAIRESVEKYRQLVENSLQGFSIVQDERFVFCNNAFATMTGYSVEELLSFPHSIALVYPEDRAICP